MKKNLIYIALLALVAGVFFIPGVKDVFFPVAEIKNAVTVEEAAYDIQLKGLNTTSTNLKNFRGKKVLFLNFWGTWCKPCREEWPSIQKLYENRKDQMDFVLIAMMDQEEDVKKFIEENGYTAPVYLAESPIEAKLLPKVFPTTFLLAPNGHILLKEEATKDWNSEESLNFIDRVTP
ncbi:TlpA family protein disulfide reductase [Bergeyella sp. RCAD1439]|uniref:TlpA family protein disulfide reductase n=1 Tax=Bergeyella anatis TaxID=3113737 RepID=UPI002E180795|nr:TlpA disulfide reductase family protein [Bergeyella sp. RCAD1439]